MPEDTAALPVLVKREIAPWLDPGTAYELLRRPKESAATEFFVVPATRSVPDWIAPETLLELELDDGLHLQRTDLRPTLPLVILR